MGCAVITVQPFLNEVMFRSVLLGEVLFKRDVFPFSLHYFNMVITSNSLIRCKSFI